MLSIVLLTYIRDRWRDRWGGKLAGSVASTSLQAAATRTNAIATDSEAKHDAKAATQHALNQLSAKGEELKQKTTSESVEKASKTAAGGAWGALISLLLTAGAAVAGGVVGAKSNRHPFAIA